MLVSVVARIYQPHGLNSKGETFHQASRLDIWCAALTPLILWCHL